MPVISIPTFPNIPEKSKVQSEYIKTMMNNGWIVSGSVYDKDKKVVVETLMLTPDPSMVGFYPVNQAAKSSSSVVTCNFVMGEPVKIISNPDPSWTSIAGVLTLDSLVGKTGKFMGQYTGETKYKGYAIVRLDEFFAGCHDCQGQVTDGHGFFCRVDSLVTLAKPEQKISHAEIKVGSTVRFIANPYPKHFGKDGDYYIGKEGEFVGPYSGIPKNVMSISVVNSYGGTDNIPAEEGTYTSSSVFVPDFAVTLSTGDMVRVIAANQDGSNKQYVGKSGYICGPLAAAVKNTKSPWEKIRVQVGIIPSLGNAPYGSKTKYSELRVSLNVNCLEVIPEDQIFPGIKVGDTVTVIDNPDYPSLVNDGQKWIGREGTFLGFPKPIKCELCGEFGTHTPECKVQNGFHYRYKYSAEIEVAGGKKIYALMGSIAKGTAKELGIFKIGDWVQLKEDVCTTLGISASTYAKKYKGISAVIIEKYYALNENHHGYNTVNFSSGQLALSNSSLIEGVTP